MVVLKYSNNLLWAICNLHTTFNIGFFFLIWIALKRRLVKYLCPFSLCPFFDCNELFFDNFSSNFRLQYVTLLCWWRTYFLPIFCHLMTFSLIQYLQDSCGLYIFWTVKNIALTKDVFHIIGKCKGCFFFILKRGRAWSS